MSINDPAIPVSPVHMKNAIKAKLDYFQSAKVEKSKRSPAAKGSAPASDIGGKKDG